MIASASRNLLSITTSLPRSICCTSPESRSPTRVANSSRMRVRSRSRTRWMMRCFAACAAVRPNSAKSTGLFEHVADFEAFVVDARLFDARSRGSRSVTSATTLRSRVILIAPRPSSISTSACTVGPYRFARAARMPSCSSTCSSVRSSCFVFVISLIALRMSTELTIRDSLRLPCERQPSVLDVGQRDTLLDSLCGADHDASPLRPSFHAEDLDLFATVERRAEHARPLSHESSPVGDRPQRPLDSGRRHLQHVLRRPTFFPPRAALRPRATHDRAIARP